MDKRGLTIVFFVFEFSSLIQFFPYTVRGSKFFSVFGLFWTLDYNFVLRKLSRGGQRRQSLI